jgi:uncharacterized protein
VARGSLGPPLITLDSSGILALLNRRDPDHERVRTALDAERAPRLFPAGIFAEIAYMIEHRLGAIVLDAFLTDIESGGLVYDCGHEDFPRIRELVSRYAGLGLGCADASVIACGERNGGRILTLDQRDFGVVAREGTIMLVPEPV